VHQVAAEPETVLLRGLEYVPHVVFGGKTELYNAHESKKERYGARHCPYMLEHYADIFLETEKNYGWKVPAEETCSASQRE
jgi:hypothetical protein